jgi:hypothetical protein
VFLVPFGNRHLSPFTVLSNKLFQVAHLDQSIGIFAGSGYL